MEACASVAMRAIKEKVFPGCVIGVIKNGAREVHAFGTLNYDGELTLPSSVYDCASVTKSVITTTLAMQLVDEGKMRLSDLVSKHHPEFRNAQAGETTIRHLLSYAVGGYALAPLVRMSAVEITNYVLTKDFDAPAGEKVRYANMPMFLLGLLIEKVVGKDLSTLARERIFEPLNMMQSSMMRPRGASVAPTEEGVSGIVHDESARVFTLEGKAVGHAGLFSTADDLLNFCESMLHAPARKEFFEEGLGWERNATWMSENHSLQTIGKTGFTGTSVLIDHEKQAAVVILSNRTYPQRPMDSSAIGEFRTQISTVVF